MVVVWCGNREGTKGGDTDGGKKGEKKMVT